MADCSSRNIDRGNDRNYLDKPENEKDQSSNIQDVLVINDDGEVRNNINELTQASKYVEQGGDAMFLANEDGALIDLLVVDDTSVKWIEIKNRKRPTNSVEATDILKGIITSS